MKTILLATLLAAGLAPMILAQEGVNKIIPAGSKVFIAPMEDSFQDYLKAALQAKKVPVVVVDDKASADFEIAGHSESEKASTAKKVIMWNWHSNEEASIAVVSVASGEVVFAYNANKQSSAHGQRSTAEACAKHIKEKIEEAK